MDGGESLGEQESKVKVEEPKAMSSREHRKMMQRLGLEETRQYTMSFDPQEKRLVATDRESACVHSIWLKDGPPK